MIIDLDKIKELNTLEGSSSNRYNASFLAMVNNSRPFMILFFFQMTIQGFVDLRIQSVNIVLETVSHDFYILVVTLL